MNERLKSKITRLESKVPPILQRVFTRFEGEPLPDDYNPDKDRVITYCERDMRVYDEQTN